jgi:hypothetical protein
VATELEAHKAHYVEVPSESRPGRVHRVWTGDRFSPPHCTCEHFRFGERRPGEAFRCKHLVKVVLAKQEGGVVVREAGPQLADMQICEVHCGSVTLTAIVVGPIAGEVWAQRLGTVTDGFLAVLGSNEAYLFQDWPEVSLEARYVAEKFPRAMDAAGDHPSRAQLANALTVALADAMGRPTVLMEE